MSLLSRGYTQSFKGAGTGPPHSLRLPSGERRINSKKRKKTRLHTLKPSYTRTRYTGSLAKFFFLESIRLSPGSLAIPDGLRQICQSYGWGTLVPEGWDIRSVVKAWQLAVVTLLAFRVSFPNYRYEFYIPGYFFLPPIEV